MTMILMKDYTPEACDYDSAYVSFDEHDPEHMRSVLSQLEDRLRRGDDDPTLRFAVKVLRSQIANVALRHRPVSPASTREEIQDFVAQKTLAVVGMSRAPRSFSAIANRELRSRGYRLFAVNPHADAVRGEPCYRSVAAIPEDVGGALILTPPAATGAAVREAAAAGVTRLWIQQGAESPEALAFCREEGLGVVSGHCILMFVEPLRAPHRIHRWMKGLLSGLPAPSRR